MDYFKDVDDFKAKTGYIIDDVWYPRVTSIVNIKSKPALYMYYGGLKSYGQGEEIKRISAEEGTLVHEIAEKIIIGGNPVVDPSIAPAIKAFKEFLANTKVHVDKDWVEKRIVHFGERYAGTIDAMAIIDGKFGVLDIKTSQAIYRDYNLQTSAYFASLQDIHRNLQTRWILRIDQQQTCLLCGGSRRTKGGREKIKRPVRSKGHPFCHEGEHEWAEMKGIIEIQEFPYWQDDFHAFLGAKRLWEWENVGLLKKACYI